MSKFHAIELRKDGKSYTEISKILKIPKSTLSYWLKNVKISLVKKKLLLEKSRRAGFKALLKRNKLQTKLAKERAIKIKQAASLEINKIDKENLKLIGSALYLGEGGKTPNRVDFTNSNEKIIKLMMLFFRKICKVPEEKFRVWISLYDQSKIHETKLFWSKVTKIRLEQFLKPNLTISKYSKKRRKNKLPFGTIQVRIADVKLFHTIQGWIQGILREFDNVPG